MPQVKNTDRFDVTTLLQPNVPLSARTMKRRTGMKHCAVLAAVHQAIERGEVRRVKAAEVGSGKYNAADQRPDPRTSAANAAAVLTHDDEHDGKKGKKRKMDKARKFNVFVLV
jgi:hypothetical protein